MPSSINMGAKGEKVTQLHVMNHIVEEKGKRGSDENAWKHNDEIEILLFEILILVIPQQKRIASLLPATKKWKNFYSSVWREIIVAPSQQQRNVTEQGQTIPKHYG